MFCKNCGSSVKEGIKFCPKCGKALTQKAVQKSGSFPFTGAQEAVRMPGAGRIQGNSGNRKKLFVIVAAAAAAIAILLAVCYRNAHKEYTIVGEWVSTDEVDMGWLIDAVMEENGISGMSAEILLSALAAWYEVSDNLTFVFYERGEFGITVGGIGVSFLETTYEQMPNGKLNLNFGFTGILKQIPIRGLSFHVKCKVGKNKMSMELFGNDLHFRRTN